MRRTKTRDRKYRIIASFLAAVLLFSLTPAAALAAEDGSGLETDFSQQMPATTGENIEPLVEEDANYEILGATSYTKAAIDKLIGGNLTLNQSRSLSINKNVDKFFRVVLKSPGKLTLSFGAWSSSRPDISLYSFRDSNKVAYQTSYNVAYSNPASYWWLPKGTYYVFVEGSSYANTSFQINPKFSAYSETTTETIPGHNNSRARAVALTFDKGYKGIIGSYGTSTFSPDKVDYYKFTLTYNTEVTINTSGAGEVKGSYYRILNARGESEGLGRVGVKNTGGLNKGTYYIVIGNSSYPDGGCYNLRVTKGPHLEAAWANKSRGITKLYWSPVAGADRYDIYRSTDYGQTWKRLKSTYPTTRSYNVTTPRYSTYEYMICSIDGGKRSNWSQVWRITIY